MKQKVIICLYAPANKGKTSTIRKVYELLGGREDFLKSSYEISDIVMRGDIKIGCESLGDPDSDQKEWLEELMKKQCDIIVTASRTKGDTVGNVDALAEQYGYAIKWISPIYGYEEEKEHILEIFHQANAEVIINLINKIIGGKL